MTRTTTNTGRPPGLHRPARPVPEVAWWHFGTAFAVGLVLHFLGWGGQPIALLGLLLLVLKLFSNALQGQRGSFSTALTLGTLMNAEVFIRDFALRGLPAGYLALEYAVILLGLASLPGLMAREGKLLKAAPVLIFFGICLWDLVGLLYSEDLLYGRITTGLHWAGLASVILGAVAFSADETRRGLLDGLIMGAFLSLGVMLRETVRSSYGTALDSGFRFGHALVSAVQVGIVLTTGMIACLLKLTGGYGKPSNALVPLAILAPFCIATFSRGPMLAFFAGALCLSVRRRRSQSWWKLPAAGALLTVALLTVMWALPSNFNNRYQELQGSDERGRIWRVVGEMWKQSPLLGYGPGSWFSVYPRFAAKADRAPTRVSDAHNFILQAAADGGAIGVGLFVLFFVTLLARIARARSSLGLALYAYIFITASLANFKLSVLFLLLGAALGDGRNPSPWRRNNLPVRPGTATGSRRVAGRRWIPPPDQKVPGHHPTVPVPS